MAINNINILIFDIIVLTIIKWGGVGNWIYVPNTDHFSNYRP